VAPEDVAEEAVADGYGIFTGKARHKAVLRFTPERARWVADEQWHPEQSGQMRVDGSYELTVPYSDARELVGEILRHGAGVEVVRPKKLRDAVAGALKQALDTYHARSEARVGAV
jgi:proteasome accessory factor C